jgi:hypothetical protein
MSSAPPTLMTLSLPKSMPALWQAYLNIARGWPAPKRITYGLYSGGATLEVKRAAIGKLKYPQPL